MTTRKNGGMAAMIQQNVRIFSSILIYACLAGMYIWQTMEIFPINVADAFIGAATLLGVALILESAISKTKKATLIFLTCMSGAAIFTALTGHFLAKDALTFGTFFGSLVGPALLFTLGGLIFICYWTLLSGKTRTNPKIGSGNSISS